MQLREERMSGAMVKWHLEGAPFAAVLHQFTEPDHGHPHSHPWPFQSTILHGGYREQVFQLDGSFEFVDRNPGDTFNIPAQHIHRIVDLPNGECWTMILPGEHVQTSGFYDFREDGSYHRFWHEPEFTKL